MTEVLNHELKPDTLYLAEENGGWSLWERTASHDIQLVEWEGDISDPPRRHSHEWNEGIRFFVVPTEQKDAIIMVARHMHKHQWEQFCARFVANLERQVT